MHLVFLSWLQVLAGSVRLSVGRCSTVVKRSVLQEFGLQFYPGSATGSSDEALVLKGVPTTASAAACSALCAYLSSYPANSPTAAWVSQQVSQQQHSLVLELFQLAADRLCLLQLSGLIIG
jgi:hypothetical protein